MVIGWLLGRYEGANLLDGSPWGRVETTQKHPRLPCLLVPQPAHAVLAGDLAAVLLPEVFGEIPPEIRQAISMHDTGWAMGDAGQLQRLRSDSTPGSEPAMPISFLAATPEEAEKAWTASIEYVTKLTPRGGWIVSRHFSLLAGTTETIHKRFIAAEEARRHSFETKPGSVENSKEQMEQMERWTAALGFCDLLSLYLVAGLSGSASLPLAHPSSPQAAVSPQVSVKREGDLLHCTPRVFRAAVELHLEALRHPIADKDLRTEQLRWKTL